MSDSSALSFPLWTVMTQKRRDHVSRVVAMLDRWTIALNVDDTEACAWRDAGAWHDALRDCDEPVLRELTGDHVRPYGMLHGPAAALRLSSDGEHRLDVLEAIRWHTIGNVQWSRAGRALYMADFLEPGRNFMQTDRRFLAERVPDAFDEVFRQVVRVRIEWALREGKGLAPETIELWNAVR